MTSRQDPMQSVLTHKELSALLYAARLISEDPDNFGPHSYMTRYEGTALRRAIDKLTPRSKEKH